jgi:alkylation response protein AidB-like acyl-CoA dehydrogenase
VVRREAVTPTRETERSADAAFREELRAWLRAHPPPEVGTTTSPEDAAVLRGWQETMSRDRWVGVHWPPEYGGRGASVTQVAIYNQELARAAAPELLGRAGITLVGPTLMAHGTEQQRGRWMPRILNGDDVWCQLFSEPDAGSDLANLSTRAERRGDTYLVRGQKVWSSHASFADWGIALVRTEPGAARHRGLSMLAVPMTANGVEVRPLRQITGESGFNEVFLDDVEIAAENRIGPEHEGWAVANTTLANERGAGFIWKQEVRCRSALERLIQECVRRGVVGDPIVRQRLAQAWIDLEIFRLHNARTLAGLERRADLGTESSLVKLWWAGASQRLYETAATVLGAAMLVERGDHDEPSPPWAHELLASRANSIMGGTSEIQRNIIGERLLGLPREPRS